MFGPLYVEGDSWIGIREKRDEIRNELSRRHLFVYLFLAILIGSVLLIINHFVGYYGQPNRVAFILAVGAALLSSAFLLLQMLLLAAGYVIAYQWEREHPLDKQNDEI